MPEGATTITVFKDDRAKLEELYGTPTHAAFRRVLERRCPHPDEQRQYTTALIPAPAEGFVEGGPQPQVYSAYRCALCGRFVVPGMPL